MGGGSKVTELRLAFFFLLFSANKEHPTGGNEGRNAGTQARANVLSWELKFNPISVSSCPRGPSPTAQIPVILQ